MGSCKSPVAPLMSHASALARTVRDAYFSGPEGGNRVESLFIVQNMERYATRSNQGYSFPSRAHPVSPPGSLGISSGAAVSDALAAQGWEGTPESPKNVAITCSRAHKRVKHELLPPRPSLPCNQRFSSRHTGSGLLWLRSSLPLLHLDKPIHDEAFLSRKFRTFSGNWLT